MSQPESSRFLISSLIDPAAVDLHLDGTDRAAVLQTLVRRIPGFEDKPDAREQLLRALLEREQLHTTGIGDGVALPHAREAVAGLVQQPMIILGRHSRGLAYGSIDAQPVRLLFLLVASTVTQHLQILARISRLIRDPVLRKSLLAVERPEHALARIREAEEKT